MRAINSSPRMKYSAFVSPISKLKRTNQDSEPTTPGNRSSATCYLDSRSSSDNVCSSSSTNILSLSARLSYKQRHPRQIKGETSKTKKINELFERLTNNFPSLEEKNKLKRVKSEEAISQPLQSTKNSEFRSKLKEIQDKLAKFNMRDCLGSPGRILLSPSKDSQRINKATKQCKNLCLELKKKVLKDTVSTTSSESFSKTFAIQDFSLGKLLGQGKFSRVYLARHRRSGLLVALKMIKKETIRREKFSNQLVREFAIQSYFNHVNLVRLFGIFNDHVNIYLILEYCPGGQLYDIFKVRSKLKDEEWSPIMKGICEGIFALHLHDVIHRDLKPENVLLAFGLPKIGDFGWAVHSPGDRRDTFCGTPLYISPELLMGGNYDKQVDIWALGVMMYEFVTGRIPFRLNQNKKLAEIVNQKIEFPDDLEQKCCSLLKMILNKDPQRRIGIWDILQHPFLKDCLSGTGMVGNFLRSGQ